MNCAVPCLLSPFAFFIESQSVFMSLLTTRVVEILSRQHFFLRGSFYTEIRHGIILYCVIQMPHVKNFNAKYEGLSKIKKVKFPK